MIMLLDPGFPGFAMPDQTHDQHEHLWSILPCTCPCSKLWVQVLPDQQEVFREACAFFQASGCQTQEQVTSWWRCAPPTRQPCSSTAAPKGCWLFQQSSSMHGGELQPCCLHMSRVLIARMHHCAYILCAVYSTAPEGNTINLRLLLHVVHILSESLLRMYCFACCIWSAVTP